MQLRSEAFSQGNPIPTRYTCDGEDLSPPLSWAGIPPGTGSLALVVEDPDAPDPDAPQRTWVHWILYNIPPDTRALPEGMKPRTLPRGTGLGLNDWQREGWGGPCPPRGRHRYFFRLYALDTPLDNLNAPTRSALEQAMVGHILAESSLMGTYVRH